MKEKILELRRRGYSYKEIKKELGCSISTISFHCVNEGLNSALVNPKKVDDKTIEEIKQKSIFLTVKELSEEFNLSVSTIKKYTKDIRKLNKKNKRLTKRNSSIEKICIGCGKNFQAKYRTNKYCVNSCRYDLYNKKMVSLWLKGEHDGITGKIATSRWIKKYLIKIHGEKCMKCGWCKKNPYTGNIPIELEHIDGNYKNNNIDNLELLCPNCHSLTSTYKGANRSKGRPRN